MSRGSFGIEVIAQNPQNRHCRGLYRIRFRLVGRAPQTPPPGRALALSMSDLAAAAASGKGQRIVPPRRVGIPIHTTVFRPHFPSGAGRKRKFSKRTIVGSEPSSDPMSSICRIRPGSNDSPISDPMGLDPISANIGSDPVWGRSDIGSEPRRIQCHQYRIRPRWIQ